MPATGVRSIEPVGHGRPDIASISLALARPRLPVKPSSPPPIAILGVERTGELHPPVIYLFTRIYSRGLAVHNERQSSGKRIMKRHDAEVLSLVQSALCLLLGSGGVRYNPGDDAPAAPQTERRLTQIKLGKVGDPEVTTVS